MGENELWLLKLKEWKGYGYNVSNYGLYSTQTIAEDVGMEKVENDENAIDYYVTPIRCSKELANRLRKGD